MGTPRAIGFDLDGTLFDHHGSARAGVARFLRGFGVEATEAVLRDWFTAEDEQFERWRSGAISFQEQRRARLRTVLPPLGVVVAEDDAGLDAVFDDYSGAYRDAWRLFPESLPLLHELREHGHRLGLLTNGTGDPATRQARTDRAGRRVRRRLHLGTHRVPEAGRPRVRNPGAGARRGPGGLSLRGRRPRARRGRCQGGRDAGGAGRPRAAGAPRHPGARAVSALTSPPVSVLTSPPVSVLTSPRPRRRGRPRWPGCRSRR
ncbi:HAD family hydrolase [Curtobacterium flaccumfaciens]|nr:HAD family hydrolase [Curtobacterium flaccumfaciens]